MEVTVADYSDIDDVLELQSKYHIASINEEDKASGFVTTAFTKPQLSNLIRDEGGIIHRSERSGFGGLRNGSFMVLLVAMANVCPHDQGASRA